MDEGHHASHDSFGEIENTSSTMGHLHEISSFELGLWFVLYGCIAILAVAGNALVVWIVMTRRKLQTVTNYFIVNLAVADAMTGMLAIPFKFQATLLQQWVLPDFMCGLMPFIETVSLSVSVFTLTATAVDRLRAVVYPTSKMKKSIANFIIAIIWITSVACSVPYGVGHNVELMPGDPDENGPAANVSICLPTHSNESWWKIYNVYLTIVQYFVPLLVIDLAYGFIAYKVWLTKPVIDYSDPNSQSFERSKKRVVKMLVIVVAVFTFCWLPYETYLVLCEVRPNVNNYYYINIIFFCSHWLAMSNSCLNPIIYGIYNEKFQREYKRVYMRCCGMTDRPMTLSSPQHSVHVNPITNDTNVELRHLKANGVSPSLSGSNLEKSATMLAIDKATSCHYYIASELGRDDSDNEESD